MEELQQILKDNNSLPYLFIGSGISKRYIGAPLWKNLLIELCKRINKPFSMYLSQIDTVLKDQHKGDLGFEYAAAATLIEKDYNLIWFTSDEIFFKERREYSKDILNSGEKFSPFKLDITELLTNHLMDFNIENHEQKEELDVFRKLSAKSIGGIITTNYDSFIEDILFTDFETIIGQQNLLFSDIFGVQEIYKIHGCCSIPESVIITYSDYLAYDEKQPYLAAKLLTIFVEHPIIFLGFSLDDPNIERLIKSISIGLSEHQLKKFFNKLILISWDDTLEHDEYKLSTVYKFNIPIVQFIVSNYEKLFELIHENRATYNPTVFKRIRDSIYEVIRTNKPSEILMINDRESDEILEDGQIIIGFSKEPTVVTKSVPAYLSDVDLFNDLLLDNLGLTKYSEEDITSIIFSASYPVSYSVPLLKYLPQMGKSINDDRYKIMKANILKRRSIKKPNLTIPKKLLLSNSIPDIIASGDIDFSTKFDLLCHKNMDNNIDEIRSFLIANIDELKSENRSQFRRVCRFFDYCLYKSNLSMLKE